MLATVLIGYYFVVIRPNPNDYMTIYLLDTQKKAENYPEFLVKGENGTFSVYVNVENHKETAQSCQVQVKITSDVNTSFPAPVDATQSFSETVQTGELWENLVTLSLNEEGYYSVVFELWANNDSGILEFSGNFCVLNVQVADNTA